MVRVGVMQTNDDIENERGLFQTEKNVCNKKNAHDDGRNSIDVHISNDANVMSMWQ